MKKSFYLAAVTAILLAMGFRCADAQPAPSQILTLPNGAKYQYIGSTYDTVVSPLHPTENAGTIVNMGQQFETPQLFLWFHRMGTNAQTRGLNLIARLADQDGVERGTSARLYFDANSTLEHVEFPDVPKRSKLLRCIFYPEDSDFHDTNAPVASITISNPLYGRFPEWTPEGLPAVKQVGDVEVRVENLMTGIQTYGRITTENGKTKVNFAPAYKGIRLETFVDVLLKSTGNTNEEWMVHNAEISDATGNVIRNMEFMPVNLGFPSERARSIGLPSNTRTFWTTLWPDESAWKLKLEIKRFTGFSSNELVTFRNVPLMRDTNINRSAWTASAGPVWTQFQISTQFITMTQRNLQMGSRGTVWVTNIDSIPVSTSHYSLIGTTNELWMSNSTGPFQVVLMEDMRWSPIIVSASGGPKFHVKIPNAPDGWEVDIIQVTTPSGEPVGTGSGNDMIPNVATHVLKIEPFRMLYPPKGTTAVDIVCVVQKTRSVEFLVKPPEIE